MTDLIRGCFAQSPLYTNNDERCQEEKQAEMKVEDEAVDKERNQIRDEVDALINRLHEQNRGEQCYGSMRDTLQEEGTRLKFKLNAALHNAQLTVLQTGEARARQEAETVQTLLSRLIAAENQWDKAENQALDISGTGALSAAAKRALLRQSTTVPQLMQCMQSEQRMMPMAQLPDTASQANPVQTRSAPVEPRVQTTSTGADDITTIGQDKMTPEEKFWHELSMAILNFGKLPDFLELDNGNIGSELKYNDLKRNFNYLAIGPEGAPAWKKVYDETLQQLQQLQQKIKIPEGVSRDKVVEMLNEVGVPFTLSNNNEVVLNPFDLYNEALPVLLELKNQNESNGYPSDEIRNKLRSLMDKSVELGKSYSSIIENFRVKINNNYPFSEMPADENTSLSGWLDSMIPPFESIDKSNINFYKSIVALIQAWQQKFNDFKEKFAEVLKSSDGPDKETQKNKFSKEKVDEMVAILEELELLKEQAALILGDVSINDIDQLLQGTGIKCKEKVGTIAIIDLGDDLTKMLKKAVTDCFSKIEGDKDAKYVVTSEQLTQFQKTLDQSKEQFDATTKKVGTKADHTSGVFKSTQEAISNLLSQMIAMLSELCKNIR
ncbi:hypothetical protein [Enterobacter bugandensis]|uniref:hypothetical protein n=1 Tax=Enterobacter bugandensis TaxID=881260 RepID=UPI00235DD8EC|nr:hypothetical protein [Enterobacter bugandensis]